MVKLRPGRSYRDFKIPYTRRSKYKQKSYVKMALPTKIVQFHSGNIKGTFDSAVIVLSKSTRQIRDNALEAARVVANKYLTDNIGEQNFHLELSTYPHQVLREHKLATGAGADRFSSGMQQAFGKPIGLAARIYAGSKIFQINLPKANIEEGKTAAIKIGKKLGLPILAVVH